MDALILLLLGFFPAGDHILVAGLGHDNFEVRDWCDVLLRKRGIVVHKTLKQNFQHQDAEVRRRCRVTAELIVTDTVATFHQLPMIDALWFRKPEKDTACNNAFRNGYDVTDDPIRGLLRRTYERYIYSSYDYVDDRDTSSFMYYAATRRLLCEALRADVPLETINGVLEYMRDRDQEYFAFLGLTPYWGH